MSFPATPPTIRPKIADILVAPGEGVTFNGLGPTPLGQARLEWSRRGISRLEWVDSWSHEESHQDLGLFAATRPREDNRLATQLLIALFTAYRAGGDLTGWPLDLVGSPFQLEVWHLLRRLPFGKTASYGELGNLLGRPQAARAVGQACAANRIALLVPCHRALSKRAGPLHFRWGSERKQLLLELERGQEMIRVEPGPG